MRKSLTTFIEQWGDQWVDPENWDPVYTSELSTNDKSVYLKRKKALQAYLSSSIPLETISENTGISKSELYRIVRRAFMTRSDGQPVGYLACVPRYRVKAYERTSAGKTGTAGLMVQFLNSQPELKKLLDDMALGKSKIDQTVLRGRNIKRVWLHFRTACQKQGIDLSDTYPFTNVDGGREAIRNYVKSVQLMDFASSARVIYGDSTGKLARENGTVIPKIPKKPYSIVQMDGHKIDGVFVLTMLDAQGELVELPLSRLWLLVMIDLSSRCILGYHISLLENYSSEDVLSCFASTLETWKSKEIEGVSDAYRTDAGLPSGVIDACRWRAFDKLQYDNSWAHLSAWVQERMIDCGVNEIVSIKPRSPRSDSIVERFMKTFEQVSFHQWPNTTGSNSSDPRRRNPEKAAKRLKIGMDELEIATDLCIANYNATPHESLNGRSPMEFLRYRLNHSNDIPRYAPSKSMDGLKLYERDFPRTIRSYLSQGHKPCVRFMNVRYTSATLKERPDLHGSKAVFRVNIKDIRTGLLFLESGECVGQLSAEDRWLEKAHSIHTRRAIARLTKHKKLLSDSHQPVTDYINYLENRAQSLRRARNRVVKVTNDAKNDDRIVSNRQLKNVDKKQFKRTRSKITLTATVSR